MAIGLMGCPAGRSATDAAAMIARDRAAQSEKSDVHAARPSGMLKLHIRLAKF